MFERSASAGRSISFQPGKNNMTRNRPVHAFTIIEVLVVCSILTLLISLLLPSYAKSRQAARASMCASNVRQLSICYNAYSIDQNGLLFPYQGSKIFMPQLLQYHSGDPRIRFCPEAEADNPVSGWGGAKFAWQYGSYQGSYAVNGFMYNAQGGDVGNEGGHGFFNPALYTWPAMWYGSRWENVPDHSRTPVFADSSWVDAWPRANETVPTIFDGRPWDIYMEMARIAIDRHDMSVNVAFMDQSARRLRLKELWTLPWHKGWVAPDPLPSIP